ncbi:MAG: hypothetical protein ABI679_08895 [Gemmatimonadota bacterium]
MIGRIYRKGELLADQVDCDVKRDYRREDEHEGWRGEAWLPLDVHLLPGDRVTWDPAEGPSVEIMIERIAVDGSSGRIFVRWIGVEPLTDSTPREESA